MPRRPRQRPAPPTRSGSPEDNRQYGRSSSSSSSTKSRVSQIIRSRQQQCSDICRSPRLIVWDPTELLKPMSQNMPTDERSFASSRTLERMYAPMDLREKVRRMARWRPEIGTGFLNAGPWSDLEYRWLLFTSIATAMVDEYMQGPVVADYTLHQCAVGLGLSNWSSCGAYPVWRQQMRGILALNDEMYYTGLGYRAMEGLYFAKFPVRVVRDFDVYRPYIEKMLWRCQPPIPGQEIHAELPLYIPFLVQCWRPQVDYSIISYVLNSHVYTRADIEQFCDNIDYIIGPCAPLDQGLTKAEVARRLKSRPYFDPVRDALKPFGKFH